MALFQSSPQPFAPGLALQDGSLLNRILGIFVGSVSSGLTATGTTLATALGLTSTTNQFSTVAANTGATLPAMIPGQTVFIYNDGASPLTVYAANGITIDGTAGSVGVTLTNAKRCAYTMMSTTAIESAQLGVVSA